ncbi:MAG: M28 family peptidase [Promethearchaeota archaeon]
MSNKYIIDSDENSDYMYNVISEIINKCGPRAPCSNAERKASELMHDELSKYCDTVELEKFKTYPRAFLGWIRLDVSLILISIGIFVGFFLIDQIFPYQIFLFMGSIICLLIGIFGLFIFYKQFFCYEEWTPKFLPYKQGTSQNVVGTIKPKGEIKKRIIFSGHIDSAFRFNLIHYTKQGYAYFYAMGVVLLISYIIIYLFQIVFIFIPEIFVFVILNLLIWIIILIPIILTVVFLGFKNSKKVLFGALKNMSLNGYVSILSTTIYSLLIDIVLWQFIFINQNLMKIVIWLLIKSIINIVALVFFASRKATPGVIDNLSAVAPVVCIGKILKDWKDNYPELLPKKTEVKLVLFGCEEIGLRGSLAFCNLHAKEYNQIDTTAVNGESLTESRFQKIFTRENTTRTDLSPEVYNLLVKCCEELEIPYKLVEMPSMAGGTDAAGLVKGGLKASSLEGIIWEDYLTYYHTDRDALNLINEKRKPNDDIGSNWNERNVRCAMENGLKIMLKYLELKDKE